MRTYSKIILLSAIQQSSNALVSVPRPFLGRMSTHHMSSRDQFSDSVYDNGSDNSMGDFGRSSNPADNLEARLSNLDNRSRGEQSDFRPCLADQVFAKKEATKVQGSTLKTWTFNSVAVEAVHVVMRTEGRPLDADVELWHGPDNTPVKMRVYVEDGRLRPFSAMLATPRGPNTIALRNIGHLEFPLDVSCVADSPDLAASTDTDALRSEPMIIQGGALRTFPFESNVESIQVLLNTDGRPLNARLELLNGPNSIKQTVELYTEDGMDRPFFMVMESPGSGNVVRIVNTATMEFPLSARVEAYSINTSFDADEPIMGGDSNEGFMNGPGSWMGGRR